jgi:hypothetical protein
MLRIKYQETAGQKAEHRKLSTVFKKEAWQGNEK